MAPKPKPKKKPYDPDALAAQRKQMSAELKVPVPPVDPDEAIARQIRRGKRARGEFVERQFDEPLERTDGEDSLPSLRKVTVRRKKQ